MTKYIQTTHGLLVPVSYAESLAPPDFEEIATTADGRDITRGYVDAMLPMQPQDEILLGKGGGDYKLYEEIKRDWQVASTFQQRRSAVVSKEYMVEPGGNRRIDKKAADSLKEQLDDLNFDAVTDKMLWGIYYGRAYAECLWARDGGQVRLDAIKVRNRRRFKIRGDGALVLITTENPMGEVLGERKWWTFVTGADNDDEPYGLGLAHWLYWPVFFKRNGVKFWSIFLNKFGSPTVVGKYQANATPDDKRKLLAAARAVQVDSGIIIPDGMMLELLEATRGGTVSHDVFIDRMDSAISKVVLSQTMTTDDGASLAQGVVHKEVRDEVVVADADLVCQTFNRGPARWLTEWNYPGAEPPSVWRKIDDEPDQKEQADREKVIFGMGYRPTLKHILDTYGGEWERVDAAKEPPAETPKNAPAPPPEFAEGTGPHDAPGAIVDQVERETGEIIDDWVEQVRDLVEKSASLEDARDRLLDLYDSLPVDVLADRMGQALALIDQIGRAEVLDEDAS